MATLDEIKMAIGKLTFDERAELARWLHGWEDDAWDRQMTDDAAAGRLNAILAEVDDDIRNGRLRDLP